MVSDPRMKTRRAVLATGGAMALAAIASSRSAMAQETRRPSDRPSDLSPDLPPDLRGAIDASTHGAAPDSVIDQTRTLQRLVDTSAATGRPLYLPPGRYDVSGLTLPDDIRLTGVAGATRLVQAGGGPLLRAEGGRRIEISGITLEGVDRAVAASGAENADALVSLSGIAEVIITDCKISGGAGHGLRLERCGGRVTGSSISGAGLAGLYSVEATGLSITDNSVSDCGNGGILVHRWSVGRDDTVVMRNRVTRISALAGGTGQNGNGINIFRAGNVMVAHNHVSDCAFSAIRANAASNVQINGNQCLMSGETAIYAEFGFQGAVISDNLIDGAANGILVVNFDEDGRLATVSGNVVRNLSLEGPYEHDGAGFGFGISAEADTAVTGNVIENAPRWGIVLGWGPYMRSVVASGNIVRKAPIGIAVTVVEGAGTAILSGNVLDETPDGAIVGFRWKERATEDLVDGAVGYPHLTVTGNRKV